MNRRGFLGLLGASAAVALIGELPSSKTFFLAPAGGWRPSDLEAYARKYKHALAESLRYTKEVRRADVLNRGFGLAQPKPEGGSIAYDDGIALFSRAHPESNVLMTNHDLNEAALETLSGEMEKLPDGRLTFRGVKVVTDPHLIGNAWYLRTPKLFT